MTSSKQVDEPDTDKSFRDLVGRPSAAIRAMIKGLRDLPSKEFRIDMDSFGDARAGPDGGVCCYGCAATCAVLSVTASAPSWISQHGVLPSENWESWFAEAHGYSVHEVRAFEYAIDALRSARVGTFLQYFDLVDDSPTSTLWPRLCLPHLHTENYLAKLGPYEAYASQLEEIGY